MPPRCGQVPRGGGQQRVVDAGLDDFAVAAEEQESGPDGSFARVGLDCGGVQDHLGQRFVAAIPARWSSGLVVGDDQPVVGIVEPVDHPAERHLVERRGDLLFGRAHCHLSGVLELPEGIDGRPCLPAEFAFGCGVEPEGSEVLSGGYPTPGLSGKFPCAVRGPVVGRIVAEVLEDAVGEGAYEGRLSGRSGNLSMYRYFQRRGHCR